MPDSLSDLSVVIPFYNEVVETVERLSDELRLLGAEVIVVDDGSFLSPSNCLKHGYNYGYGAALMTGIRNATRPICLTMDGDGQHTVQDVVNLYKVYKMLNVAMVIGRRTVINESPVRYCGRKFLNIIATFFTGKWMADLNSGMRIFDRLLVEGYFSILCKQFSFTTSLTMSLMTDRHKVEFFPINVLERAYGKSKVRVIKHGIITLYYIVRIGFALRTRVFRNWIRKQIWWFPWREGSAYSRLIGKIGSMPFFREKNGKQ